MRPKTGLSPGYGAFCVANFWGNLSAERERAQATAMARATRKAAAPIE